MAAGYSFQNHQLSAAERLWLMEAAAAGFSPRAAKAKLYGQLPRGFSPDRIDPRLYALNRVTPVGLWHLNPKHTLLSAIDRTLRCVKARILGDHKVKTITAEEVARASWLTHPVPHERFTRWVTSDTFSSGQRAPPPGPAWA
jgi:hypothetical protein